MPTPVPTELPRALLGMPAARFMAEYWQRQPLYVPGAFAPEEVADIGPEALFLAVADDRVESRLIQNSELHFGPFPRRQLAGLGKADWILLVQNMDRVHASARAVLGHFEFLPNWRLDDLMISYAVPGGSAGPHVDQYDVFLIQGSGSKRWAIDASADPDLELIPEHPLGILRRFEPTSQWDLAPGDLLYLPPGIPHHGTAIEAGTTWSMGLRAPSVGELWIDFAEHQLMDCPDTQRFADPDRPLAGNVIGSHDLAQARQLLGGVATTDEAQLARWFGRLVTRRDDLELPAPGGRLPEVDAPADLAPAPGVRVAWFAQGKQGWLFADGRDFATTAQLAELMGDAGVLTPALQQQARDLGGAALLIQLVDDGLWVGRGLARGT